MLSRSLSSERRFARSITEDWHSLRRRWWRNYLREQHPEII